MCDQIMESKQARGQEKNSTQNNLQLHGLRVQVWESVGGCCCCCCCNHENVHQRQWGYFTVKCHAVPTPNCAQMVFGVRFYLIVVKVAVAMIESTTGPVGSRFKAMVVVEFLTNGASPSRLWCTNFKPCTSDVFRSATKSLAGSKNPNAECMNTRAYPWKVSFSGEEGKRVRDLSLDEGISVQRRTHRLRGLLTSLRLLCGVCVLNPNISPWESTLCTASRRDDGSSHRGRCASLRHGALARGMSRRLRPSWLDPFSLKAGIHTAFAAMPASPRTPWVSAPSRSGSPCVLASCSPMRSSCMRPAATQGNNSRARCPLAAVQQWMRMGWTLDCCIR